MKMRKIEVNQIQGFRLGNAENKDAATGCTVIICEKGAVGGVDVRGGAPATRNTDLLKSENSVDKVNAVVLSGGSSFGLEACSGVMRFLSKNDVGYSVNNGPAVPVVCGAALNDLEVGRSDAFPDVEMGRHACENAYRGVFGNGNNGAGTGASCGKYLGMDRAMKTGLGTFACADDYLQIGAISAVNAVGDVVGGSGKITAGLRSADGKKISGTVKAMREKIHSGYSEDSWDFEAVENEQKMERSIKEKPSRKQSRSDGFIIENTKNHEKNDIAAAMMAAFENSKDPDANGVDKRAYSPSDDSDRRRSEKDRASKGRAARSSSAAAYVEAFKAEALARAKQASKAAPSTDGGNNNEAAVIMAGGKHATAAFDGSNSHKKSGPSDNTYFDLTDQVKAGSTVSADNNSYFDPSEEYLNEYLSSVSDQNSSVSRVQKHSADDQSVQTGNAEGRGMRSYDGIAEDGEKDDDLGYDIPFNTVLSCLITNAKLSRSQANKLASILHDAYARALKPTHTTMDGDTIFVLATGKQEVDFDAFAALATDVLQYAIIDGALSARSAYGLPAAREFSK